MPWPRQRRSSSKLGGDAQPGEDPDCAHRARLRVSGFKIQRGKNRFKLSRDRIKILVEPTASLRHSDAEIVGPVQGSNQSPDQKAGASTTG